jgi:hypothetical protein
MQQLSLLGRDDEAACYHYYAALLRGEGQEHVPAVERVKLEAAASLHFLETLRHALTCSSATGRDRRSDTW